MPAFDGSVDAVSRLQLGQPRDGDAVDPNSDLSLTWSTDDPLIIFVNFVGEAGVVVCNFDPAPGMAKIPGAIVKAATTPTAGSTCKAGACVGYLSTLRVRTTHVVAGTYDVAITHGSFVDRTVTLTD